MDFPQKETEQETLAQVDILTIVKQTRLLLLLVIIIYDLGLITERIVFSAAVFSLSFGIASRRVESKQ